MVPTKRRFRSRGKFRRLRRRGGRTLRLKGFVKGIVKRMQEIKYSLSSTTVVTGYAGAASVDTDVTPSISQSVGKRGRIGTNIQYKYIQFRMSLGWFAITTIPTTSNVFGIIRIILWQPRMDPDTAPNYTVDDILMGTTGGQSTRLLAPISNNKGRVLMDKTINMAPYPNAQYSQLPSNIKLRFKTRIHNKVNYQNDASTLPKDPKDRYILSVIFPDSGAGASNIAVTQVTRISYFDM